MSATLQELVLTVVALSTVLNTAFLALVWSRIDTKQAQIEHVDKRVSIVEARLSDVGEVKARLVELSSAVAALNERSETTLEMVHSIQEHLRGRNG